MQTAQLAKITTGEGGNNNPHLVTLTNSWGEVKLLT